jgi:anti-sigma factor RsiW
VTGTDFEGIDLDRLADYVSGALDGTPDAAAVADLVATDPRWTRAHAALVAADALVRADLAELADRPEPMPDDVMARLDAAFAAEPPLTAAVPDQKPPLAVLPGGRATAVPTVPRRRWRSVVGVAAAVVILGVGAVSLAPRLSEHSKSTASRSDAGSAVSQGGVPPATAPKSASNLERGASGAPGINASGSNYTDQTLSALGAAVGPPITSQGDSARSNRPNALEAPSPAAVPLTAVPEALRPLAQPDARDSCVKAILKEYGGTATLLDYAQYQGSPALVVVIDGAHGMPGRKWVVVVGPKCGTGGAIADERYSAQLG